MESDAPESGWTDDDINNFFWFDFDTIADWLGYKDENQSFDAFQKLREIGVRCFHAGKNAPCGASVMMYSYGNDSLQLQIK